MAKFSAILAVISIAVAGVQATSDKPGGFNVMPQDLMACGSSSRTRLGMCYAMDSVTGSDNMFGRGRPHG